eukprot:6212929-Pleurochrysis_carterae.AAC.4
MRSAASDRLSPARTCAHANAPLRVHGAGTWSCTRSCAHATDAQMRGSHAGRRMCECKDARAYLRTHTYTRSRARRQSKQLCVQARRHGRTLKHSPSCTHAPSHAYAPLNRKEVSTEVHKSMRTHANIRMRTHAHIPKHVYLRESVYKVGTHAHNEIYGSE